MGDRQSQPRSTLFRGKKGIKDVVQTFSLDSPARVRDFDLDAFPLLLFSRGGLYGQHSFMSDGLGGIQE